MVLGHLIRKKEYKMDPSYYNQMFPGGTGGDGGGYGGGNQLGALGGNSGAGGQSGWQSVLSDTGGIGDLLSGIFGNSGSPYGAAGNAYSQYAQMGANAINPYNTMGQNAMSNYANWAQTMQNPAQFQNNLMNQYQESPNAKFMQQQAMRSGQNMGSAAGLMGSTPLAMQMQQNAGNISQQDMQNWMSNAFGINQQYGNAQENMMGTGLMGANSLLGLYGQEAGAQGMAAYGQAQGNQSNTANMIGGLASLAADIPW